MSDKLLTDEQKKELDSMIQDICNMASDVVNDYEENPSEISGSVVVIHENSPFMNDMYKSNRWKYVIHGDVNDGINAIKNKKINKDVDSNK
jgi:hypothetical protein